MAQSINFLGLRRGSTKSLTFSVVDGKQITKDRVEGGKNPRTPAQMSQRCLLYTICNAYSAMKSVCNHSFEEVSAGLQCMYKFRKENMKQLRLCKETGNGFFGFSKYQQSGMVPGSYILSMGSLPDSCPDVAISSVTVASKLVTINIAAGESISDITYQMGCKNFKDTCTIALMYPKPNGFYGFGSVCFTYKQGDTVLGSFDIDVSGDVIYATPTFDASGLSVSMTLNQPLASNATVNNSYVAAIASRMVNGVWHRSNAQFDVQNATPTFDQAIATYPVGVERILNGRSSTGTASAGSGTSPAPSNTGGTNTGGSTGGDNSGGDNSGGGDNGGSDSGDGFTQ